MSPHAYSVCDAPAQVSNRLDSPIARGFLESQQFVEASSVNARAVEFIAKPGRVQHLQNCMRCEVADLLKRQSGFAGILVLTSHKEPRLIRVLSLWDTASQATENHWEDSLAVRKLVSALVDVCAKVHTYEAALPESADAAPRTTRDLSDLRMC